MIKKIASYTVIFGCLYLLVILLFDVAVMPGYVRMGEGRYMVNVKGKRFSMQKKYWLRKDTKALYLIPYILILTKQGQSWINILRQIQE